MSTREYRDNKLLYYGKNVFGLSAYMSIWVFLLLAAAIWRVVEKILIWNGDTAFAFVVAIIYVIVAFAAALSIRGCEKGGLYLNIAFLIFTIIWAPVDMSFSAANDMVNAVASNDSLVSLLGGVTNSVFSTIYRSILWFFQEVVSIVFLVVFIKHRKFFMVDYITMKRKYMNDMAVGTGE